MQRSLAKNLQIVRNRIRAAPPPRQCCDVFISHRGVDTKRSIAGLLYQHITGPELRLRAFLDDKNMKPGDRLFENIDSAIRECRLGITVFSPRFCDSYFCLHELALFVECKKKLVPVFCDVKPSELRVKDDGGCPPEELRRFNMALEQAKYTVGLTFDSSKGYVYRSIPLLY